MKHDPSIKTSKLINGIEYDQFEGLSFTAFYNSHEIESSSEFRKFVCHLVLEDVLKVPNFKEFFLTQETAIKKLKAKYTEINSDNSRIYIFYDLRKGLRYMPDSAMFNFGQETTKQIEENYNIKIGKKVGIISAEVAKSYKTLKTFHKIYDQYAHFDIVTNLEDAYKSIQDI